MKRFGPDGLTAGPEGVATVEDQLKKEDYEAYLRREVQTSENRLKPLIRAAEAREAHAQAGRQLTSAVEAYSKKGQELLGPFANLKPDDPIPAEHIDKLTGGTDVEASRDHIEGFQEAKDPDEYVPTVVECPKCTTKCQVTSGKQDTIRCPKCSNAFEVKT